MAIRSYILHKGFVLASCFVEDVCYKWSFYLFSRKLYKDIKKDNISIFKQNKAFPIRELALNYNKWHLKKKKNCFLFDIKNTIKKAIIVYCENDTPQSIFYNQRCHIMYLQNGYIYDNECFYRKKITKEQNNLFCRFVFYS